MGAVGALIIVLALLCICLGPAPAGPAQRADAIDLPISSGDFNAVYFGTLAISDVEGRLENIRDIRAFPTPTGVRILALSRSLLGPVIVSGQGLESGNSTRLRVAVHLHLPFWPWSRSDAFYGPRD